MWKTEKCAKNICKYPNNKPLNNKAMWTESHQKYNYFNKEKNWHDT